MIPEKNTTIPQKKYFIGLIGLGLMLIALSVLPEILSGGKKGFGHIQIFLLRNGMLIFFTSTVLLFYPRVIHYISDTFNGSVNESERTKHNMVEVSLSKYEIVSLLVCLAAANLFAVYFVGKEMYIYNWDGAHFWSKYIQISDKFKDNPLSAAVSVITSIQDSEYNYLAPFILAPFSLLFGTDRLPYVLSLVNIFVFLSSISFLLLYKRAVSTMFGEQPPFGAMFTALFTFFAFPFIWIPLLFGYLGVCGISIIFIILFIYFQYPLPMQRYRTLIFLGVLISTLVLIRRWYSFWAISFFIALIINEAVYLFKEYRFDRHRFVVLAKKTLVIIFSSGIFFIMIAGPRLMQVLSTDYSYLSLFVSGNIFKHLKGFAEYFGPFFIALSLLGMFISFYYRNTRKLASFLLIQWIIMFVLFTRVQNFYPHHYYLLQPTILLFISLFITALFMKSKSKRLRSTICSVYIMLLGIIFHFVFFPEASIYANKTKDFVTKVRHYPLVRADIDEIKRMLNVIDRLLSGTDERVYVLSSSEVLNSDILQFAQKSLTGTPKIAKYVFRSSNVDLADGFPDNLFKAKYVIIADPIQCDLGCKRNARIIGIPAEAILNGQSMGTSYRKLPYEFTLEDSVKVYIYERIGSFKQADMEFLSDQLREYYPDKPFVYQPDAQRR